MKSVRDKPLMSLNACLPKALALERDVVIGGISLDSRRLQEGDLFAALQGFEHDGHDYVASAVAQGAAAIIVQKPISASFPGADSVPVIVDRHLRQDLGAIAARYYGDPSHGMWGCAVTGTNGKTSVAWYIATLLNALGRKTGFSGTIGWGVPPRLNSSNLTTADAISLQRRLAEFAHQNSDCFVMEASSHALEQNRMDGVDLNCAVFTNLSRDHLDYHTDMLSYADVKKRLFQRSSLNAAIINVDDDVGREIVRSLPTGIEVLGFGRSGAADVRWTDVRYLDTGVSAKLQSPWGRHNLTLPLYGEFNVANAVAAICATVTQGAAIEDVLKATSQLKPAAGRMEFFPGRNSALAVVDYAHTPDALIKALEALRHHTTGRLICVFGCGGGRDKGKRRMMAKAVQSKADEAWLTTDNPRCESPESIAQETRTGFEPGFPVTVELNRKRAIEGALVLAEKGDTVLVAGKGHESYQEIMGVKHDFSDRILISRLQEVR